MADLGPMFPEGVVPKYGPDGPICPQCGVPADATQFINQPMRTPNGERYFQRVVVGQYCTTCQKPVP